MTLTRSKTEQRPVCFYCKIDLDPRDQNTRATAPPAMALPAGVGVVICTPACPELPEWATAYRHPRWETA